MCEECGEAEACWMVSFNIVKRYPMDSSGDADWSEGEVIQNEDDPIPMCEDCAHEYKC